MPKLTSISSTFPALKDSGISGSGTRAYYALISYYASSLAGAAFYNEHFRDILNIGYVGGIGGGNSLPQIPIIYMGNTTNQIAAQIFAGASSTQTNPATLATGTFLNATNACGEFGNAMIDAYSDGTISNIRQRYNDTVVKHYLNASAINSDHSNRRIVYILFNGRVRAVDRLYGSWNTPMENTQDFVVSSLNATMQGSASYHKVRKELTILSFVANGGSFNCFTFSNVDFDAYPDPYVALNRPEVTRTNAALSLATSWAVNNNESYYNLKPIVTFNGTVFVSVFFTSSSLSLYSFTRSGTSAITATRVTTLGVLVQSYGLDQGSQYGQRTITSRDGTTVATFCPYYRYGSGIACYMIDKINNTYSTYLNTDTTFGVQIIPTGDSDWRFYYAGDARSGNYTASYLVAYYMKQNSGGFTDVNSRQYLPYFTGPNSTNYSGITQVVDYPMTPDNKYGPK
jgi:hypothetical protein